MGSPERRPQFSESTIKRVHLPKVGDAELIFSSWDQLATSFQQFTSENLQRIHLPARDVAMERKLRREEKKTALPNYSDEEMRFYQTYYETPLTNTGHVEKMLENIKKDASNGRFHTTVEKTRSYGRVLFGSQIKVEPYSHNEASFYKVSVGSEFLGNRLEDVLEGNGAERATQPKFVSIEYAQKDEKFTIDFDDVSERLRTVFGSDAPKLSGYDLAYSLHTSDNIKDKVIDLGSYDGLSLRMHCRHEVGFKREKNVVGGRIPKLVEGGWLPATLDFSLVSSGIKKGSNLEENIILPTQHQQAQNLAERIADAFRP